MICKIDTTSIPGRRGCGFNNEVTKDVLDFYKSEWEAAEVNIGKYKNLKSATQAYRSAIDNAKVGVQAVTREGRLFLIRKAG